MSSNNGSTTSTPPDVAFLGLPFDAQSTFSRGAAEAPQVLRTRFRSYASNLWSETGVDLGCSERLRDLGDLDLENDGDATAIIEQAVDRAITDGCRVFSLGGDHSVTYPIVRAHARHYPKLSILHFDAHPDLYPDFQGNRLSHACPFARILEEGLVQRLVQVGIRGLNGIQRQQAERFGVEVVPMMEWRSDLFFEFDGPVYLSLDLDALDPAFAPGVSHRESGGLSVRDILGLLHRLEAQWIGADLVEFNPTRDVGGLTADAGAKLMKEIAALLHG